MIEYAVACCTPVDVRVVNPEDSIYDSQFTRACVAARGTPIDSIGFELSCESSGSTLDVLAADIFCLPGGCLGQATSETFKILEQAWASEMVSEISSPVWMGLM